MSDATPHFPQDRLLRVRGTVQGVGFRPFVVRLAAEFGVRGWVRNDREGVLVRAVGPAGALEHFARALTERAPAAAVVTGVEWSAPGAGTPEVNGAFVIVASSEPEGAVATNVPVDLAPCADCRRELATPDDRRAGYVFINCTQCGPRYSIIESLPYDRPRTTMRAFQMCPECRREYTETVDRRFHAEPNACPHCGPALRLFDGAGLTAAKADRALEFAAAALLNGEIVAVKGVGGFHLMVDAANETAVATLRQRKHREEKPFAVMFADLAMLERWAVVSEEAAQLLTSPQAPIVLVPRRPIADGRTVTDPVAPAGRGSAAPAPGVAPGNPWIGALLPSSPLHVRLLSAVNRPLVATSANRSDEPLCTDDEEARTRLAGIADWFLGHDRPIARPVDDSVVRFTRAKAAIVLRRARGYAPSPLTLPSALPAPMVCVGAQMKNTIGVASDRRLILSPHLGDLDGVATHQVFTRTIETLTGLFAAQPARVACDKHPDYASTRWAAASGLPCVPVQHHLAHVLAVLLEHDTPAHDVLGIAWDGTGYGEDGTIWGGEFFLLRAGRAHRFARLRPFPLPGGDAAVKDPRRVALSLALTGGLPWEATARRLGFNDRETATLETMIRRGLNSPACSSIGRLFDGFGAALGLGLRNAFEGQTPLAVEIAATAHASFSGELPFPLRGAIEAATWEIDWEPALDCVLAKRDLPPGALAAAMHRGLARALSAVATAADAPTVVLSGGCFQNALLRDLAEAELRQQGRRVLTARALPPNDGAIAAGQALGALWGLTTVEMPGRSVR